MIILPAVGFVDWKDVQSKSMGLLRLLLAVAVVFCTML